MTQFEFYHQVTRWSWRQVGWYVCASLLIVGLVTSSRWQLRTKPLWQQFVNEVRQEVQAHYPAHLQLTWNGQTLTSSVSPLLIPYPQAISADWRQSASLAVIDTTHSYQDNQTNLPSDAWFVFDASQLYTKSSDQWQAIPLNTVPGFEQPFTVSATTLPSTLDQIANTLQTGLGFLSVGIWLTQPLWLGITLLAQTLINAWMVWALSNLVGQKQSFSATWKVALAAGLVAELLHQLVWLVYGYPTEFTFNIVFWLIIGFWSLHPTANRFQPEGKR